MTKQEFAMFAAAMKTYFSREERLLPNDQAMELWFRQLKDMPFQVAEAALNKWVATNKWSPSIAELRETAAEIVNGQLPDWGIGWQQVQRAIKRYGQYRQREAIAEMDEITRECVERLGYQTLCMSENAEWDMTNFRRLYEIIAQRRKEESQMPKALLELIAGFAAKKMIGGGEN